MINYQIITEGREYENFSYPELMKEFLDDLIKGFLLLEKENEENYKEIVFDLKIYEFNIITCESLDSKVNLFNNIVSMLNTEYDRNMEHMKFIIENY